MIKMEDIARLAGVSKAAVSIAINGKNGISQETREKILKTINEYGYKPLRKHTNNKARILTKVNIIITTNHKGMVKQNYRSLPFFDNLISTLINKFSSFGINTHLDTVEIPNLQENIEKIIKLQKPEATIVLATELKRKDILLLKEKLNVCVFLDNYYSDIRADFLTVDNYFGAYAAAKYIIKKGYKDIGYVASSIPNSNFKKRKQGFCDAVRNSNLRIYKDQIYSVLPVVENDSKDEMKTFTSNLNKLPKVLFCENDYIAIKLIKHFTNLNISIPKEIAIMGFDDIYAAKLISPELTTVHVAIDQIADQAIFQLQQQAQSEIWEPQKSILSTRIIERSSV